MEGTRRSHTPDEAARLREEAAALAAAAHPGVAEVLGVEDDGTTVVLRTAAGEGPVLAEVEGLAPDEVAAIVAALAATVADLHARELVCGDLAAERIRLAADGRPVLLTLGASRQHGPAGDVEALGRLALRLLDRASAGGRNGDEASAALARLAAEACDPDPARRPSAAAFAAAIARRVPTARLPEPSPGPAVLGRARTTVARRRWPALSRPARRVLLGLAMAAALLAPFLLHPGPRTERRAPPSPPGTGPSAPPPLRSPTTLRARPPARTERPPACPPTPSPALDPDGDGCVEPLRWDAGVLEVAGTRYALGQPGDHVLAGDWDCDGRDTVALWRPGTGELFAFAGWAGAGHDLAGARAATVPDATGARAEDVEGDGCDEVVLARRDREPAVVRLAPAG